MSEAPRVEIRRLASGVPNLDVVLGGGMPEYSLLILAGGPGTGKTTLAQQIMFANAQSDQPAIYFTVLGEPTVKLMRFQQQYAFFDREKVGRTVRYVNLSDVVQRLGLRRTIEALNSQVAEVNPSLIIVDSFRTLLVAASSESQRQLQYFLQELSIQLATWQITSILVGEYGREELVGNPAFTVADGIVWLTQDVHGNSAVRRLQVLKMRGQAPVPGLHSFRISSDGVRVFPRLLEVEMNPPALAPHGRLGTGLPELDEMMGGGIPEGETTLVAGPSGTGKTILSLQYVVEGARVGEPGVMVSFEEVPEEHVRKAANFGWDLPQLERNDLLELIYLRPVDLSVEEVLERIERAVSRIRAKRVVINSVAGFELAVAPTERPEFREALYRLIRGLAARRITVMMTTEVPESFGELQFSFFNVSFLTDNIVFLRYVEIESRLAVALAVIKMRTSRHSRELRQYDITERGIVVRGAFAEYSGVLSGLPVPSVAVSLLGLQLFEDQQRVITALLARGESTAEQIAEATHLDLELVRGVLTNLSRRRYVAEVVEPGRITYHAVLPELQPRRTIRPPPRNTGPTEFAAPSEPG